MSVAALLAVLAYTFFTGTPRLVPDGGVIVQPVSWSDYQTLTREYRRFAWFVPIRERPRNLTRRALFGYDFAAGNQNRGWILDRSASGKWLLYIDAKGNGDLRDAAPLQFESKDGVERVDVSFRQAGSAFPCRFTILPHWRNSRGKTLFVLSIDERTARSGSLDIAGRRASFKLLGNAGIYTDPAQPALSIQQSNQWQQYGAGERTINLFGKSYAFRIRPDGSALTLRQLPRAISERASLEPGSKAPPFSALAAYRGRSVLLDFWATFCDPCRSDEPHLVALYRATSRSKFAILGIAADTSAGDVKRFTRKAGATWAQILDGWNGPVHKLYRASAMPTYYLIGPDGRIQAAWTGAGRVDAIVSKYLR